MPKVAASTHCRKPPIASRRPRGRAAVRALEGELLDTIRSMGKQVVDLTPEQRAALKDKTRPVHKSFLANNRELIPVYKQVLGKLGG